MGANETALKYEYINAHNPLFEIKPHEQSSINH